MRTRKVIALSLLSGAAVLFSGCPNQPPGPCVIARTGGGGAEGIGSPYLVKYYLKTGGSTGDCTTNPFMAPYAGDFVAALYAEAYGPVTAINKITGMVPEEFGWTGGYTGDYVQGSPNSTPPVTNNPVIAGNFTTDTEDVNNECTVMGTAPGVQLINGVTVSYNYTSMLVYTNAAAGEGTQIQADVTITRTDGVNTCTNNYTALGLWPETVCNVNDDCNPNPEPAIGRALGSGILTGIPVKCDLTLVAEDNVIVPGNIPVDPPVACTIDGMGNDSCAANGQECVNTTTTGGGVACTVAADGTDSCDADPTSTEACVTCDASGCTPVAPGGSGNCGTIAGVCAVPYLDGYGCPSPQPYTLLTGGCGGGAHDNNGTGGTNLCFYVNASATAPFPYTGTFSP
jgi:hypothetical protein